MRVSRSLRRRPRSRGGWSEGRDFPPFNIFPKVLRDLIPFQKVYPKRKVRFFEGFFECTNLQLLFRRGEGYQVEVGVGAGFEGDPRSKSPDGGPGQLTFLEGLHLLSFSGG